MINYSLIYFIVIENQRAHLWVIQEGSLLMQVPKLRPCREVFLWLGYVFLITESRLMITKLIETKSVTLLLIQAVVLLNVPC